MTPRQVSPSAKRCRDASKRGRVWQAIWPSCGTKKRKEVLHTRLQSMPEISEHSTADHEHDLTSLETGGNVANSCANSLARTAYKSIGQAPRARIMLPHSNFS